MMSDAHVLDGVTPAKEVGPEVVNACPEFLDGCVTPTTEAGSEVDSPCPELPDGVTPADEAGSEVPLVQNKKSRTKSRSCFGRRKVRATPASEAASEVDTPCSELPDDVTPAEEAGSEVDSPCP